MDFDFGALERRIEAAARQAFSDAIERVGNESIYAFALYSDDGAMTVCPAVNTVEYVEQNDAKNPGDSDYYRFETAEWKYEAVGAEDQFKVICDTVRNEVLAKEEDEAWFEAFQQQLYETCERVLVKLKGEGFFEEKLGREVFLLFNVTEFEFSKAELLDLPACHPSSSWR